MLRLSDRAENLEAIEQRLKLDILAEAAKWVRIAHEVHHLTGAFLGTAVSF
jgi:hypothetical protein